MFVRTRRSARHFLGLSVLFFCLAMLYLRHHHAIDLVSYEEDPTILLLLILGTIILLRPHAWMLASIAVVVIFTPASAGPWLVSHGIPGGMVTLFACCLVA